MRKLTLQFNTLVVLENREARNQKIKSSVMADSRSLGKNDLELNRNSSMAAEMAKLQLGTPQFSTRWSTIEHLRSKGASLDGSEASALKATNASKHSELHVAKNAIEHDNLISSLLIWMTPNLFQYYCTKVPKDKVKEAFKLIRSQREGPIEIIQS